jgi:hypothetical protein
MRERRLHRCVAIPSDERLAAILDSATYECGALTRTTRMAIKRLGLAVAEIAQLSRGLRAPSCRK